MKRSRIKSMASKPQGAQPRRMATGRLLRSMMTQEKLRLLEAVWMDLSRHPEDVMSPEGHQHVLAEREQRIASGESRFLEWNQAKADILRQLG